MLIRVQAAAITLARFTEASCLLWLIRPVRGPAYTTDEYLEVVGTVLKRGKRVVVAEVTISRPNGELCLKATLTSAVFDSRIIDLPRLADI